METVAPVVITDIDSVWDEIEPILARIAIRTHEKWSPQDVKAELLNGNAKLLYASDAFVIWKVIVCRFTGEVTLWLWIGHGFGPDVMGRYDDTLVSLAKIVGASRIAFDSTRLGYMRRLAGTPWGPARIEYERSI